MLRCIVPRLAIAVLVAAGAPAQVTRQAPRVEIRRAPRAIQTQWQTDRPGRVRVVRPVLIQDEQPELDAGTAFDAFLRNHATYVGPFGAEGDYQIPEYDGPRLEEGFGVGYDGLTFRYGIEEADFRNRFDPFYYEPRGQMMRRLNREDMTRRAERSLSQHERAVHSGTDLLRQGEYARAVVTLTLAAKLNHGDPACRVHLAQARLALGHYDAAGRALRRAMELQPKLVYIDLQLARYYPAPGDFAQFTQRLAGHLKTAEAPSADQFFLLGYLEFQRGRFAEAHDAFSRADRRRPGDEAVQAFLEITRPAAAR